MLKRVISLLPIFERPRGQVTCLTGILTDIISIVCLPTQADGGSYGIWNPWRGCHRISDGCKFCYIHKGDTKRGIDTNNVVITDRFLAPIETKKNGEYKMKSGQSVYLCFSSDFLLEDADKWRSQCFDIIKERSDLHFIFLTKRIERFMDCIPQDWVCVQAKKADIDIN